MANLIELAKQNADELLRSAYTSAVAAEVLPAGAELAGTVEIPKDVSNGDYAAIEVTRRKSAGDFSQKPKA